MARVRADAGETLPAVRAAFRAAAGERDAARVAALMAEGESRLAFLRMTTPRHLLPAAVRGEAGVRRMRHDGAGVVDGAAAAEATAHSNGHHRIYESDVSRHRALMDRMHFKGPVWE